MAQSNWTRCVVKLKRQLAASKGHKRRQKPANLGRQVIVTGKLSPEALERLNKAGVRIIMKAPDA